MQFEEESGEEVDFVAILDKKDKLTMKVGAGRDPEMETSPSNLLTKLLGENPSYTPKHQSRASR